MSAEEILGRQFGKSLSRLTKPQARDINLKNTVRGGFRPPGQGTDRLPPLGDFEAPPSAAYVDTTRGVHYHPKFRYRDN